MSLTPGFTITSSAPLRVVRTPWFELRQNQDVTSTDYGREWVEMGGVLACGHRIKATSRMSIAALGRNYRAMVARHVTRCPHPVSGTR